MRLSIYCLPFLESFSRYDLLEGKKVRVHTASWQMEGTVKGINSSGQLLLVSDDNKEHAFSYGEASLRPLVEVS